MKFYSFWRFGLGMKIAQDGKWTRQGNWHPFSLSITRDSEAPTWAINLIFLRWSFWLGIDIK